MLFDICQGDLTEEAWFFVIFVSFYKPRFVLIRLPKPDILAKIRAVNPSASTTWKRKSGTASHSQNRRRLAISKLVAPDPT